MVSSARVLENSMYTVDSVGKHHVYATFRFQYFRFCSGSSQKRHIFQRKIDIPVCIKEKNKTARILHVKHKSSSNTWCTPRVSWKTRCKLSILSANIMSTLLSGFHTSGFALAPHRNVTSSNGRSTYLCVSKIKTKLHEYFT